jgi:translocation and assembly module TamA
LDRPLESIAEFERRQAEILAASRNGEAPNSQTASAIPPVTTPAKDAGELDRALGDAMPPIGEAPIQDAELVAPLPPIDSFDVTPVTFAEAEQDSIAREVAYEVVISGIEEVDSQGEISVKDLFKSLSALHQGKGKADNFAMLRARMNADEELMKRIMASEGYYDAAVDARVERGARGQPIKTNVNVLPGIRYKFSSLRIAHDPTVPPTLIEDNFPLKVGEAIVAQRVQGAEAALALRLPEYGYAFAEIGQRDILLDGATGEGDYNLPITIGPRVRFRNIETTGKLAFDADHIEVLTRFDRGDLYDSRKVDDLRQAMVATGLFSNISAEPKRTGELAEDGSEYVDLLVTQQAGPPRTIAGSLGYGTGEGLRVQGSWTHRNLFPPEGALIANALLGTQEQRLGVTMRRSNAGKRDRTFELVAEGLRSRYDAFDAITGRLGFRISRVSTPIWQKKLTYAFGADVIATREDDYNFDTNQRENDFYTILGVTGQVGMDRSDSLLDPTKGFRLTALVRPEGSLAGKFTPYAVTQLDGSAYYPVMDSLVLAGRVRIGSILGADRERLAPSRRFYGGGGGSVRGFGYQQLGPKDPNNDPIGGRSMNEVAVEARYRFGDYGIVGFVDAGQVYRSSMPDFSNMRLGVGLGGRFYTNFGPMRLDVATPIGRKPGESRVSVYVSIGQAF